MKKVILNFLLCSFSILLSLILAEYLLKIFKYEKFSLFNPETPKNMYSWDKETIYSNNYQQKNNYLPGQSWKTKKPIQLRPDYRPNQDIQKNTFSILTIGDSFVYGHNLEDLETYPSQLEEILIKKGYNINVLNAGTSGYGVDQYYLQTLKTLKIFKPNLVIINLNENDIADSNENCLFKQTRLGDFKRVTTYTSTIYLQSVIVKFFPRWLINSNIANLIFKATRFNTRKNLSCSLANKNYTENLILGKIVFLLKDLETKLAEEKITLIITFVPIQTYFDPQFPNNHYTLVLRKKIINSLIEVNSKIVDMNLRLAPSYLFALREENNYITMNNNYDHDILGLKDVSREYFLDDSQEPESVHGMKHLNQKGNYLFAQEVANLIIPILDNFE